MDKLGLHIIGGFSGNLGRPRCVKLVDASLEYVREVRKATGPDCIIIVRWYEPDQSLANPAGAAQDWYRCYEAAMRAMAEGDTNIAFEGYNEIDDTSAAAFCAMEVERLRLMHQGGLRSVVGNFSVGTPNERLWGTTYKPLLNALGPGDFLGLHEYWENAAELDNRWLCGRWTLMPELKGVPIVITECGHGDDGRTGDNRGWRGAGIGPAGYLAELERYNALMAAWPNVLGAVVYTAGNNDDARHGYDPSEVWPQVVGRYTGAPWTDPSKAQPAPAPPAPVQGYYQSDRHGYKPAWIILHDTEGSAQAALAWWRSPDNHGKSSAHYLVRSDGQVVACVPEEYVAHHAGGGTWPGIPTGSVGGTSIINLCSIGIELEYPAAPASPAWTEAQLAAAASLIWQLAKRYGIARDHVLLHCEVDPANRSDPRNFDKEGFLDRIWPRLQPAPIAADIRNAAWNARGIVYNPDAAFPRYAREHGLGNPVTGEVDVAGVRLQGFSGGIVWARIGEWGNCQHMPW